MDKKQLLILDTLYNYLDYHNPMEPTINTELTFYISNNNWHFSLFTKNELVMKNGGTNDKRPVSGRYLRIEPNVPAPERSWWGRRDLLVQR